MINHLAAYSQVFKDYPDVLEVPHLCKILNKSDKTVRSYLQKGIIKSKKEGKSYLVFKADLIQYFMD